jgi:hypothetical protein
MLILSKRKRLELWALLCEKVEDYFESVDSGPVSLPSDPGELRALLRPLDFIEPVPPEDAIELVVKGLRRHQVHTSHTGYFGLFNPSPTTMGIAADFLVAAFNPQMAACSHSPLACEIELHLIRAFGQKFAYLEEVAAGAPCHNYELSDSVE